MDSIALRFLIHLVADAHAPLHSREMFSEKLFDGKIRDGD